MKYLKQFISLMFCIEKYPRRIFIGVLRHRNEEIFQSSLALRVTVNII